MIAETPSETMIGPCASVLETNALERALRLFLERKNAKWLEHWRLKGPLVREPGELLNRYQARGHLVKWAIAERKLDDSYTYDQMKGGQASKYLAIIFHRTREDRLSMAAELERYVQLQAEMKAHAIYRKHPELDPQAAPPDLSDDSWLVQAEYDELA